MVLFFSMDFTETGTVTLYISQVHSTCLPCSNFPVLFVNQNLVVISGLINASNTSDIGLRISISAIASFGFAFTGIVVIDLKQVYQKQIYVFWHSQNL